MTDESNSKHDALQEAKTDPASGEALGDALNELEDLLDSGSERPDTAADGDRIAEGQYTIPLLSDVVATSPPASGEAGSENPEQVSRPHPSLNEDEICRELLGRLASEIEIIVQTAVEGALKQARTDVNAQLRRHLDIVLPEVLEEILEQRTRTPR